MSINNRKRNSFKNKSMKLLDRIWVVILIVLILWVSLHYSNKFNQEEQQIDKITKIK